jgi:hypothetical protein
MGNESTVPLLDPSDLAGTRTRLLMIAARGVTIRVLGYYPFAALLACRQIAVA